MDPLRQPQAPSAEQDVGAILDLGLPGTDIEREWEINVSRLFPHGFHTVGVVFSTEMDST